MDAIIRTTVTRTDGTPFMSATAVYNGIDDAAKKAFQDLIAEYKADAVAVLGGELTAPSAEPLGLNLTFSLSFSDGSAGESLSLTNVPYKVLHTLEYLLTDKAGAMLKWGHDHSAKHGLKGADKKALKKVAKHVDVR